MIKTTHCSECRKLTECTLIMGEYLCKKCLSEADEEDLDDLDPLDEFTHDYRDLI